MLVVTLAESTPVHEADRLQTDLRRAGIEPFGWVINASLTSSVTTHPVLQARVVSELARIARVEELSARGTWRVDWQADPPVGAVALRQLTGDMNRAAPVGGV
jgi:arsenite/tail-anchored protein-transporting ATPase